MEKAWLCWRMFVVSKDKNAAQKARKRASAANLRAILEKKRKNHVRGGVRVLAKGVAYTKTQMSIFNKMLFVAVGRTKNAFTA